MADTRYLIRQAHGGEIREIGDDALPFFPGWVIIETLGAPPATALPAVPVVHYADANALRPDTIQPVVWYGTVEPANLDDSRGDAWVNSGLGLTAAQIAADPTVRAAFGLLASPTGGNDTAMINAALTANGRVSTQPGKNYLTSGLITVPAGRSLIIAEGSSITATGAGAGIVLAGQGAKVIGPGVFDGANLINYLVTINAAKTLTSGVTLRNSNLYGINLAAADAVIEGNVFEAIPSYALLAEGAAVVRPSFRGNTLVNCGQGAMFKDGPRDGTAADNTMQVNGGVGLEASGADNFTFTGNTITGGVGIGISLAAADHCTVVGNSVSGHTQIGIENTQGSSHNVITGNNVGPSTAGAAVGIQDTTISDTTHPQIGVAISGNLIRGQSGAGILAQRGRAHNITGNVIEDCAGSAMYVEGGAHTIANNIVRHSAPPSSWVGVEVFGGPHVFHGNTINVPTGANSICIRFAAAADTQVTDNFTQNGAYGYALNNCTRTVLNGNRSTGTTTASAFLFGTSSTCRVLTHLSTLTSGSAVTNDAGATITGPLYAI